MRFSMLGILDGRELLWFIRLLLCIFPDSASPTLLSFISAFLFYGSFVLYLTVPSLLLCFWKLGLIDDRKMADGLFLSTARDVAKDYPDIAFDAELLDNTCLKVTPLPHSYINNRSSRIQLPITTASWSCPIYTETSSPIYLLGTSLPVPTICPSLNIPPPFAEPPLVPVLFSMVRGLFIFPSSRLLSSLPFLDLLWRKADVADLLED